MDPTVFRDQPSHSDTFATRAEILNQAVAGLLTINGGAAIAVLAFLGNIVKDNPQMALALLSGLAKFSGGVLLASIIHFVRFFRAFLTESPSRHTGPDLYTAAWVFLAVLSTMAFLWGAGEIYLDGSAVLRHATEPTLHSCWANLWAWIARIGTKSL
jgi:hypothetical protein